MAMWSEPKEGMIYASFDADLTNAYEYMKSAAAK